MKLVLERSLVTCACVLTCSVLPVSFATVWTVAHQTPLSVGFSRQADCSRWPRPPPGSFDPGTECVSLTFSALGGGFLTAGAPGKRPLLVTTRRKTSLKCFSWCAHGWSLPAVQIQHKRPLFGRAFPECKAAFSPIEKQPERQWDLLQLWNLETHCCLTTHTGTHTHTSRVSVLPILPGIISDSSSCFFESKLFFNI